MTRNEFLTESFQEADEGRGRTLVSGQRALATHSVKISSRVLPREPRKPYKGVGFNSHSDSYGDLQGEDTDYFWSENTATGAKTPKNRYPGIWNAVGAREAGEKGP